MTHAPEYPSGLPLPTQGRVDVARQTTGSLRETFITVPTNSPPSSPVRSTALFHGRDLVLRKDSSAGSLSMNHLQVRLQPLSRSIVPRVHVAGTPVASGPNNLLDRPPVHRLFCSDHHHPVHPERRCRSPNLQLLPPFGPSRDVGVRPRRNEGPTSQITFCSLGSAGIGYARHFKNEGWSQTDRWTLGRDTEGGRGRGTVRVEDSRRSRSDGGCVRGCTTGERPLWVGTGRSGPKETPGRRERHQGCLRDWDDNVGVVDP